ncbi:hypothetical protein [Phenylobacterium sp.]|uniref:hypothetical protein n=1 Tax=Phenylobacterium sp. TaxID=1871053 RepID=UPI002BED18E1|nr:hypothetical protein [Phenylobacterium sp.]HLZ73787.1 hypothetical protein [Phenylobacterium sp.]
MKLWRIIALVVVGLAIVGCLVSGLRGPISLVRVQHKAALAGGKANLAAITHDILVYPTAPEAAAAIADWSPMTGDMSA